jgi:hypothetical protein
MPHPIEITLAGVVCVALGLGCYKPKIEPGGLLCAPAPDKACPDGFVCFAGNCVSSLVGQGGTTVSTGGRGGSTGSGGQSGTGGAPVGSGGSGSGGASVPDAGSRRAVGDPCTIVNSGQPDQSDDCESDAVCVDDCVPTSHCYRLCSADVDCPTSACTRKTAEASPRQICDVSFVTCDPQAQAGCSTNSACYLLSSMQTATGTDRTVCDCSMNAGAPGEACTDSRQCSPGLVCPPADVPGGGACRHICDTTALLSGCGVGTCYPFGTKWGYCYN